MYPPECDPFAHDCPDGQKCAAYGPKGWIGTKCVDVTGADKPGDACVAEGTTGVDSCAAGAICLWVDKDGVGTCVALCTGSLENPACDFPGWCSIGGIVSLCFGYCNPLLQDCPKLGDACYRAYDGFDCTTDLSDEAGKVNDPCRFEPQCEIGLTCADAAFVGAGCAPGSPSCCTLFCDFPDGACPNPDQKCVQFYDKMQFPPGDPYLDIGRCGVVG